MLEYLAVGVTFEDLLAKFPIWNATICEVGSVCQSYATNGKSGYNASSLIAGIEQAIVRAMNLDVLPQDPWPKTQAARVYLLVKNILVGLSLSVNIWELSGHFFTRFGIHCKFPNFSVAQKFSNGCFRV
jgi:hypothetical protein